MGIWPAAQGRGQAGWVWATLCTQNSKAAARLQFCAATVYRFPEPQPTAVAPGSLQVNHVIDSNLPTCSPGTPARPGSTPSHPK